MSDVVGSTPSFTRNGRPRASLSRISASLMICAVPCFKTARASSGCMITDRIAHPPSALLVFIQQLAHLLDRERLIMPVERFLTLAFVQEWPVLRVRADRNFFSRLRSISHAPRALVCISRLRIPCRLLRGDVERAAFAVKRVRVEFLRGKLSGS